ncbi:5'-AMP-activated protein kinase catalytic subunit alpha-2-like [Mizuhopecten yessoensis]|nr:5'-AMP-activated protein kinase catalytic subunit alpha-2-like [Mizuhopecten yessoensis]
MNLQLYQVDQKSFLLDFKSLNLVDVSEGSLGNSLSDSMGRSMSGSPPSSLSDLDYSSDNVLFMPGKCHTNTIEGSSCL